MLTVSWTPQIRNDDRAPPVSLGAGVCHRAPLTPHVQAHARTPTGACTHRLASSSRKRACPMVMRIRTMPGRGLIS